MLLLHQPSSDFLAGSLTTTRKIPFITSILSTPPQCSTVHLTLSSPIPCIARSAFVFSTASKAVCYRINNIDDCHCNHFHYPFHAIQLPNHIFIRKYIINKAKNKKTSPSGIPDRNVLKSPSSPYFTLYDPFPQENFLTGIFDLSVRRSQSRNRYPEW